MQSQGSVVLETSLGDVQLELYWDHAPRASGHAFIFREYSLDAYNYLLQTCKNFAELAKRGYYNGVTFHRIISVRSD